MEAPDKLDNQHMARCGCGQDGQACVFLYVEDREFHCARYRDPELAEILADIGRRLGLRVPEESYPDCLVPA